MRAKDIMSTGLASVRSDATIETAIETMLARRVSGLPVVDEQNRLVGLVTEGDFLRRGEISTDRQRPRWLRFLLGPGVMSSEYARANGRKVSEVMSEGVITTSEDADLSTLVDLMTSNGIKRIPIVRDGVPIGIVSRADLLAALSKSMPPRGPQPARDDADIRADILAEFDRTRCVPVAAIDVLVRDGIVELRGSISDERQRAAARVAVENTPGVKAIRDHMLWIEPLSGLFSVSPEDAEAARGS